MVVLSLTLLLGSTASPSSARRVALMSKDDVRRALEEEFGRQPPGLRLATETPFGGLVFGVSGVSEEERRCFHSLVRRVRRHATAAAAAAAVTATLPCPQAPASAAAAAVLRVRVQVLEPLLPVRPLPGAVLLRRQVLTVRGPQPQQTRGLALWFYYFPDPQRPHAPPPLHGAEEASRLVRTHLLLQ
jgi:hypothetical protein